MTAHAQTQKIEAILGNIKDDEDYEKDEFEQPAGDYEDDAFEQDQEDGQKA